MFGATGGPRVAHRESPRRRIRRVIWRGGAASALVALAVTGALVLPGPPGQALSTNPVCGASGSVVGCVQAWSNGLTATYRGGSAGANIQFLNWIASAAGVPGSEPVRCLGPAFSAFVPLPAGEYEGVATLVSGAPGPPHFTYDLEVGAAGSPSAPSTSCVAPPAPQSVVHAPVVGMTSTANGGGYWLVGADGTVETHGDARYAGELPGPPNQPVVGMAATPDRAGYWLDAADGGVFAFGDAGFYGSMGGLPLNQPVVGMAPTPDGGGYWLVAADGGIFAFGDAPFYGSMGGLPLNQPVVGMAADAATGGYWLVAADGGIFAFGAPFYGSTGNLVLNQPIVEMEAAPDGSGYRFVASDGGIFCFRLSFQGSLGANPPPLPIAGMAPSGADGYWAVDQLGGVFNFGNAPNWQ